MPAPEITRVRVRDFQSLGDVEIPVGRLTCLVGPSNVGKSAFVRALRLAARNGATTGLVRDGAKELSVEVEFAPWKPDAAGWAPGATRETVTKGARKSEFRWDDGAGGDWVTAKAGKDAVPPDVAAAWALPEAVAGADLTFSTQHDAPFLLAVPGTTVDAAVGRLTNAHRLTAASREAARRAGAADADAKARRRELEETVAQLRTFDGLPARRAAAAQARERLALVRDLAARRARLAQMLDARTRVTAALDESTRLASDIPDARARAEALADIGTRRELLTLVLHDRDRAAALAAVEVPDAPEVPLERLATLAAARDRLARDLAERGIRAAAADLAREQEHDTAQEANEADLALERALGSLDTCPTCGRAMEGH